MEYQNQIYELEKTRDGKITLNNSSNYFGVNNFGNSVNVLIYTPEPDHYGFSGELAKNIDTLIGKLPLNDHYKLVVDMNENPSVDPYNGYRFHVVINAHVYSNGFEKEIKNAFESADYIGPNELRKSYDSIVSRIRNRRINSLEKFVSQEAA